MTHTQPDGEDSSGTAAPSDGESAKPRELFAWAMYDWANSAYSTLLITVLVSYIQDDVLPGRWGIVLYGYGIGFTMLLSAILLPVLGAMADANASKRRWLMATAFPGAAALALMYFTSPDNPWLVAALFVAVNLGFELSFGFYNGFLPEIASEENMGRVSAWGYALGYLGGGLMLVVALVILIKGDALGLPEDIVFRKRLSLGLTGLWWGLFTIPTVAILRDKRKPRREPERFTHAARTAVREVLTTVRHIRHYRTLAIFLLGFLIYNDGVQTMWSQASVFAIQVLKMEATELGLMILMVQFIALPGALLVGWMADKFGQKLILLCTLLVWISLLIAAFFITTKPQFWVMAVFAALVLGGTQAVSRAIMGLMTPKARSAEFFGFFSLSGRATSMLGPVFFSSILALTGSPHWAIVSLLFFFAVGFLVVLPVDVQKGQDEARAANAAESAGNTTA